MTLLLEGNKKASKPANYKGFKAFCYGGLDEARTRDLRLDRPAF